MKIGIVGNGTVGYATYKCYEEQHEVRMYDIQPDLCFDTLESTLRCDLVFLCLPTPQCRDSLKCDTSTLDDFCNMLGGTVPDGNYVLKSTVPIGFTRYLSEEYGLKNLVHSPEFLTARTAIHDAAFPSRLLIGGQICDGRTALCRLYDQMWPEVPKFVVSSDESEAIKLFQNSFSAIKIAAFNEFRVLADKLGLDWERVMVGLLSGGWINPQHTQVPGPDGKMGFGGSCLSKDLSNLISIMKEHDCSHLVTSGAHVRNIFDRKREV